MPALAWEPLRAGISRREGADDEEGAARAAQLILGGTALALMRSGLRVDVSPLGVELLREGERIDLGELLMRCRDADGAEPWRRLCRETGIASVDLGTLGHAAPTGPTSSRAPRPASS